MAIEGPLKELGVHDVFQLLDLTRKTGVLRITSDVRQNAGRVLFDRGAVVSAEMRSSPARLGTQLVRAGKIGEDELVRVRAMQAAGDGRRFGELLVAVGAIGRRELDRFLRRHVEEVLFELMSWSEGYFTFEESALDGVDVDAAVRIPTEAILMEAARRIDEWSLMRQVVPHTAVVPVLAPGAGQGGLLDLVPAEWEVLAAVDGVRDLRTIADDLQRSEFETARTIFGLHATGVVAVQDPRRGAIVATPDDAAAAVVHAAQYLAMGDLETARVAAEAVAERHPQSPDALLLLARVRRGAGELAGAEQAIFEALRLAPARLDARRLLGLVHVAAGRFAEAVEQWDRWRALVDDASEEAARRPDVERWRSAAAALAAALQEQG